MRKRRRRRRRRRRDRRRGGAAFLTVSFFLDDVSGFFRNCVSASAAPLSRPLSAAQNEALWETVTLSGSARRVF